MDYKNKINLTDSYWDAKGFLKDSEIVDGIGMQKQEL